MKRYVILFLFVGLLLACGDKKKTPSMTSQQRESMLRQFVYTTAMIPEKVALERLDSLLTVAETDSATFHFTCEYLEEPFGDPNSSYRSEQLLDRVLERMIQSPLYDSLGKLRPRLQLQIVQQNRKGALSNDFFYTTPNGRKANLHALSADYVLLFFYNPDCQTCKELKTEIAGSDIISKLIDDGRLKALAVYVDEDVDLWRKNLPEMPKEWIVARDETGVLRADTVYDTKAIPSIYLLDKNKRVILKDCFSIPEIENNLPVN